MSFLSPAFLLALPLLAVPVIIHFFNRRQRQVIHWGAMDFLFASKTPRRRFLRWKELLLMLLRLAMVLFMLGALAQPLIPSGWLGTVGPREVILVVDNSLSTSRTPGSQSLYERELDELARFGQRLSGADQVRVMLAAPGPEWLTEGAVPGDAATLRGILARLRALKPQEGAADFYECVQEAMKVKSVGGLARLVVIVTDGQAYGWRANNPEAWKAIQALGKRTVPETTVSVIAAGLNAGPAANLALEKMGASRSVTGVGQSVTFTVWVKNTGTVPTPATSVAWTSGDQAIGASAVAALQPGAGTSVSLSHGLASAGVVEITARLAAHDQLARDDSQSFLLQVSKAIPVLVVQGEPRTDPAQSDTQYFLAALGQGGGPGRKATNANVFQPRLVGYQNLAKEDLAAYQCVVLANVPRLSSDLLQKLSRYVAAGGGLWIALGDQTDIGAFNRQFVEQLPGLSPVSLKQPVGDAGNREKSENVMPPPAKHSATALLADVQRLDMDRGRVYRRHQFDFDSRSGSVPVLLALEGAVPLAVEKDLGRGRVIVQAVPLGLSWCNLPLCQAYVVLVQEWLWYLSEPGLVKRNLEVGELLSASQPVESSSGSASLEMPGGRAAQLVGHDEGRRLVFRYAHTRAPGSYLLSLPGSGQPTRQERFRVNRDPGESDLTPLSEAQMKALEESGGVHFGADPLATSSAVQVEAPPRALAHWLLAALLALLAAEMLLSGSLARQRRSVSPGVVMEKGFHG